MVEYGFNTIVAIQAVDTTDNTVVNLCMAGDIYMLKLDYSLPLF